MAESDISADNVEIACSLDAADLPRRVAEWRSLLGHVVERTPIEHGLRVRFSSGVSAAAVADLADRERRCCSFFEFSIHLVRGGVTLDVRAPATAKELVDELFEVPLPSKHTKTPSRSHCVGLCFSTSHNQKTATETLDEAVAWARRRDPATAEDVAAILKHARARRTPTRKEPYRSKSPTRH